MVRRSIKCIHRIAAMSFSAECPLREGPLHIFVQHKWREKEIVQ